MKLLLAPVLILGLGAYPALASNAAPAVAVVADMNGKVLVNAGHGFVPAVSTQALNAGDRVFIGENAFATVAYGSCEVSYSKPAVFTVTAKAPCDKPVVSPVAHLPGGVVPPVVVPPVTGLPPVVTAIAIATPVAIAFGVLSEDDCVSGC